MTIASHLAAAAILAASLSAAQAEDYSITSSVTTSATPTEVWLAIGDFCDINDWHPAIATCALKARDGSVHRLLTLGDGAQVLEKLIAVEDGISYTYQIVEAPMPITKYTATLSIDIGNPSTITWAGRFSSDDPSMESVFQGLYDSGLAEIKARFP